MEIQKWIMSRVQYAFFYLERLYKLSLNILCKFYVLPTYIFTDNNAKSNYVHACMQIASAYIDIEQSSR